MHFGIFSFYLGLRGSDSGICFSEGVEGRPPEEKTPELKDVFAKVPWGGGGWIWRARILKFSRPNPHLAPYDNPHFLM